MLDIGAGKVLQRVRWRGQTVPPGGSLRVGSARGERWGGCYFFFCHMNSQMGSPLGMALVRTHRY
jgi:hypothetical protein